MCQKGIIVMLKSDFNHENTSISQANANISNNNHMKKGNVIKRSSIL